MTDEIEKPMQDPDDSIWQLTPEVAEEMKQWSQERITRKQLMIQEAQERKPLYPKTGEEGTFVGVFGYLVSAWSAREHPFYRTPSGIFFLRQRQFPV